MDATQQTRIQSLKNALLDFLGANGRHYGDLTRLEQSIEDLVQALNTRLDQLLRMADDAGCAPDCGPNPSPREQLADRLMATATALTRGGKVDREMVSQFDLALDAFDLAADLRRRSDTAKDAGETAAIRAKRESLGR